MFSEDDAANLFPALFEWTQPGKVVGITGTFNNWGSQILLKPRADDASADKAVLFVKLYLPAGLHFFKYCIDGAWKYDPEVTFAPDEYGNLNNFITIAEEIDPKTKGKVVQRPIKTIIRDGTNSLPIMNPVAAEELMKIRQQTSPVLRPSRSPPAKERLCRMTYSLDDETPKPTIAPLRAPLDTTDSEYGINVDDNHHGGSRSRAGTLTRSLSDKSLPVHEAVVDEVTPKYSNYIDNAISSSVLLAATTQHFGGDLVTHEHNMRAQLGGHRSLLVSARHEGSKPARRGGKMIVFLVGLPGRGKTFIGHVLARYLTWMGHQSKVFNTGEYRRKLVGANMNHAFWDPLNEESYQIRTDLAKQCLEDSIVALESDDCDCVVFDATNATRDRRRMLHETVMNRYKCEMMFIESISESPELIASSINEMKLNSADYAGQTLEQAAEDYHNRILHYQAMYQQLDSELEDVPFIKVIDVGRQIFCNQIYGYLQSRIMFLMANLQLRPRPIWLSRHGESMFNTQKRIGGDAPLSPLGMQYAVQLDRFIDALYPAPDTELAVWTSTMLRTGMTVERIAGRGRSVVKWKQLDEIDAGICDGMTYEQVADEMPDEYLARKNNKLHYRYPRGESYQDVIHRLEPVITELMRMDRPVLIVAHQAILRVLYAYLTNKAPSECPTLNIPLHVVIQLTPKAYQCEEVWHRPM
uniref:CBM20 domain-containing protein n=1 Tax=Globisporangium ultimum (strain ATCC 200006 / CBS 805.95 / DAOM BR144) TaxID=431595 RepID=K3WC97_GLOUD